MQRLTGHRYFPSARSVGANPSFAAPQAAERLYQTMAEELAKAGFNLNFGPVVDLSLNPHNYVIVQRDRSFGADPNIVATLAGAFIRAHRAAGIATVAKLSWAWSSTADSHKMLADVSGTWQEIEIEPYRTLAKEGLLDGVMVGHLYHPDSATGRSFRPRYRGGPSPLCAIPASKASSATTWRWARSATTIRSRSAR